MLGATDWGKVLTDLATIGTQTAVTLKSKPWKTGMQPTGPQQPVVIEDGGSSSTMKTVVIGVAVLGAGFLLYSMLKKKRA